MSPISKKNISLITTLCLVLLICFTVTVASIHADTIIVLR